MRWPLLWTVLISIGAGYLPNIDSTLSLSRTLGLLPFFALGWWLRDRDIVDRLRLLRDRSWWVFVVAGALLAIAGWAAWFFADVWRAMNLREWLFYDENYSSIGGTEWWAGGVRLTLMAIALVLSAAFFALLPRGTHWWTHFGQYTMYVYLLHSFVLYPFRESGILRDLEPTWIWLPIVIVASVLIALGLATKPVRTRLPAPRGTATGLAVRRPDPRRPRGPPVGPDRFAPPSRRAETPARPRRPAPERLRLSVRRTGRRRRTSRASAPGGTAHSPEPTWRRYSLMMSVDSDRWIRTNCSGARWYDRKNRPASSRPRSVLPSTKL